MSSIPFKEYLALPGENWSKLKNMDEGADYYRWRLDNPIEDKPAWVIGRALHTLVLEPDEFDARHPIAPVKDRKTKTWKEFAAEHADDDPLTQNEADKARSMADAVLSDRIASGILSDGEAEVTIQWTDEETGIDCRGRADWVRPGLFVDLKGTRDITVKGFAKSVGNYLYHGQAAYYADGLQAMTGEIRAFGFVASENAPPWRVRVYELDDAAMDEGRELYHGLLRRLAVCRESGVWDDGHDIQTISLPRWAFRERQ